MRRLLALALLPALLTLHPVTEPKAVAPTKVLVVVEENHSYTQMRNGMPYLFGLAQRYGYATDWTAITHPSEPNYIGIVGGSTFGITNDAIPAANAPRVGSAQSVFGQALAAGKTAKTYSESMPSNCYLQRGSGDPPLYAPKHNPWAFFGAERSQCNLYDVSAATFASNAQANTLPNVAMLVPNQLNDAHSGSLATADNWLRTTLGPVLASSDFASGNLVVVVTADEDNRKSGNKVLTVVMHPSLHGTVVATPLTHYSLTRYVAQILGVAPLRNGATAPDMRAAFGI